MSDHEIRYDNVGELKKLLVGHRIVKIEESMYEGNDAIRFTLDNNVQLIAVEAHGCGGCYNGWWPVNTSAKPGGVIMNVEIDEVDGDGGLTEIKCFIYTELGKQTLIESEGTDNGYYGWGYYLYVEEVQQ